MTQWHGYIGLENLALSGLQRATVVAQLRLLGPALHPLPCKKNHVRISSDNEKVILEAEFPTAWLTVAQIKRWMGDIFDVLPDSIGHTVTQHSWGNQMTLVATFSRGGTDYVRFGVFAGVGATWESSRLAAAGYMSADPDDWSAEE